MCCVTVIWGETRRNYIVSSSRPDLIKVPPTYLPTFYQLHGNKQTTSRKELVLFSFVIRVHVLWTAKKNITRKNSTSSGGNWSDGSQFAIDRRFYRLSYRDLRCPIKCLVEAKVYVLGLKALANLKSVCGDVINVTENSFWPAARQARQARKKMLKMFCMWRIALYSNFQQSNLLQVKARVHVLDHFWLKVVSGRLFMFSFSQECGTLGLPQVKKSNETLAKKLSRWVPC